MKSPLSLVKERFGDKEKLVEAVQKIATDDLWLDRVNEAKGLALVSNTKLLKLHDALSTTKSEFGTRAKLVLSILELEKRTKDSGYKTRLDKFAVPRLLDLHRAASKRAAKPAAKPLSGKKPARSKKAQAKTASK